MRIGVRGFTLSVAVTGCVLVWGFAVGVGSAAAATEFGESGAGLGQLEFVSGVAVDQTSGDVYVGDKSNFRITKFTGSGDPLLAWGWDVNAESPAEELQTCTAFCQKGKPGNGAGEFSGEDPHGVAVDPSTGDVYAVDSVNYRVEKFDAKGKFILMFGGEVNKTTKANVCTEEEMNSLAHVVCGVGVEGSAHGQFEWSFSGSDIAVGPSGNVYVGDKSRVQIFEETTGVFKEEIPLVEPEFPAYGAVDGLAVDSSGDMFVHYQEVEGVREFTFNKTSVKWEQKGAHFDNNPNSYAIGAIALDEAGHLYVGDSEPPGELGFHVLEYDTATGEQVASFGSETIQGSTVGGMAFANTPPGALYVTGSTIETEGHQSESRVFVFTPPPPGPLIEPYGESGTPEKHGEAKFEAEINPEGHATTYHVEYISEEQFKADGESYAAGTVNTTESASIGEGFADQYVTENLLEKTLEPGVSYHWRLVATNSQGTTNGPDNTLEETPVAGVDGPWASEVRATSAELAARIDPEGASTSYRLQYGTSTTYEHEFAGSVGEGTEFVAVGYHIQELAPGTTYHFRIVTENKCYPGKPSAVCTQESADHTFTTRPGTSEFALPDRRGWELVSPADTGGALFGDSGRAARDGSAMTYGVGGAALGDGAVSNDSLHGSRVLSRRSPGGWESQDIKPPNNSPDEGEDPSTELLGGSHFNLFSQDLMWTVLSPQVGAGTLSAEALEGTNYLRNNTTGGYTPLVTRANTPPGTSIVAEEEGQPVGLPVPQVNVLAGTPDLGHVVLGSPVALTPEAFATGKGIFSGIGNIYVWSAGRLRLVNILPNGKPTCQIGSPNGVDCEETNSVQLAGEIGGDGSVARAVSSDGRRVAWTRGSPYGNLSGGYKGLYVRDMVDETTVRLGSRTALYQTMSSDGSRVFFLERGDLYVYQAGSPYGAGTTTDLTAGHGPGEASAGVQESIADVSEDGSYVYFVANGVLGDGAEHGAKSGGCKPEALRSQATCNLYLSHEAGGVWEAPKFIAALSSEDEKDWHYSTPGPQLERVTSRVSPDGRFLAFMSNRSLTGYDNVDANPEAYEHELKEEKVVVALDKNGNPIPARDEEVFLYDSSAGRLVCVSCDPSGARPHGVLSGGARTLLVDEASAWGVYGHQHWLAGNLPGWTLYGSGDTVYQPRYLSNGGRLFFNSPVGLVPQDTNGLEDVYQYEPAGEGDCARPGGCVSLISSGESAFESAFMDASESGNDVFFVSSDHLTGGDIDSGYDVWDAHACSVSSPCLTPPVSSPPCSEEACRGAATPQPELFGPGPSETFSGAGNIVPGSEPAVKPKVLTRAQKLSRALGSCRKQYRRSKQRRTACERTAHKHYGHAAKRSRKANATKQGGK